MPHFYPFELGDVKYTMRHVGFRRFPIFRHVPYWVGSRPKFVIVTITGKQVINRTMPVYEWYPGMKGERQVGSLGPFINNRERIEFPINDCSQIPADGALEFWVHQPRMSGSWKIAEFKGNWKDQIWLIVFSSVIGFIIGIMGQIVVELIKDILTKP